MNAAKKLRTKKRVKPMWNKKRHELWLAGQLVKKFRQPAWEQELVLDAFQEEKWTDVIDDPLPQDPDHDPKERLHWTRKNLNRRQKLIRFYLLGTGEQIGWEPR